MIKNIKSETVVHLSDMVGIKPGVIASMSLVDNALCHSKLFAVSEGESISEELYKGDMIYFVLEGQMTVLVEGSEKKLGPGDILRVRADIEHEIKAGSSFKMVQTLILED